MHVPKVSNRDNNNSSSSTTYKMRGAGDGLKTMKTPLKQSATASSSLVERVPVPSCRKFTVASASATPHRRDHTMTEMMNIKKALDGLENKKHTKFNKAKSMAEITPTKSRMKKSKVTKNNGNGNSAIMLHATPRPLSDDDVDVTLTPSASRRHADDAERRLGRLVYQRFILFAWRRSRSRISTLSDSLRRRQAQVNKLEQQVFCLKDLNQSECEKRNMAINESQAIKNSLELVKAEKGQLVEQMALMTSKQTILNTKCDQQDVALKNILNEFNVKNMHAQSLENALQAEMSKMKEMQQDQTIAISKIHSQEKEILSKRETIETLHQNLKNIENQLVELKLTYKTKTTDFNELLIKYENTIKENDKVKLHWENAHEAKIKQLKVRIGNMEKELVNVTSIYEKVLLEKKRLSETLSEYENNNNNRNKCLLWTNAKDIAVVSWTILQNAAYIMLPAVL